jgi:DNA-binding transcriptional regulator of glucitol operon
MRCAHDETDTRMNTTQITITTASIIIAVGLVLAAWLHRANNSFSACVSEYETILQGPGFGLKPDAAHITAVRNCSGRGER